MINDIYIEYAKSKGKSAKEFVRLKQEYYNIDTIITKDLNGNEEETLINYKDLSNWLINRIKK